MKKTIEERTAEAVLQTPQDVVIGKRTYRVAPPCCATLIEVSKLVPSVPYVEIMGDQVNEVLAMAKDARPLFEQVAILILGAKAIRDDRPRKFLFWRKKSRLEALTDELMYECTPSEINKARGEILGMMEVGDFFEFTAFLQEIGLIQATREAVVKTTQSGQ